MPFINLQLGEAMDTNTTTNTITNTTTNTITNTTTNTITNTTTNATTNTITNTNREQMQVLRLQICMGMCVLHVCAHIGDVCATAAQCGP